MAAFVSYSDPSKFSSGFPLNPTHPNLQRIQILFQHDSASFSGGEFCCLEVSSAENSNSVFFGLFRQILNFSGAARGGGGSGGLYDKYHLILYMLYRKILWNDSKGAT